MVRSWSVIDFILIWIGGLVGTGIFVGLGFSAGSDDLLIVMGLAGQYVGNLGVFWLLRRRKEEPEVGFRIENRDVLYVGAGLVLQIAVALAIQPLAQRLFPDGRPPQQIADALQSVDSSTLLRVALIIAAVLLAPATEELLFRGVLLRALRRQGRTFAILVSSVIFSAVHVLGLDPERLLASAAVVLPPLLLLGLLLAWLTERAGRLGPAIFVHAGWNLLAAFVLTLPQETLDTLTG